MEKKITRNDVYQFFVDNYDFMMADVWQDSEGFPGNQEINMDYVKTWIEDNSNWAPYKIKMINLFDKTFKVI